MRIVRTSRMVFVAVIVAASPGAHADDSGSAPVATAASSMAASGTAVPSKAADRALRRRVLGALAKARGLQASGITVRAHDGAVMLQGWVPEQRMIDQATQVVEAVRGVTSVKNSLTLSTF